MTCSPFNSDMTLICVLYDVDNFKGILLATRQQYELVSQLLHSQKFRAVC